jgi:hypothetical protein
MAKTQHDLRGSSSDDTALRSRDLPASYASNVRVVAYGLLHDFDSTRRATLCGIPLAELHRWEFPWEGRSTTQPYCSECGVGGR